MRDEADVVLYLVNAAEQPEAAGYVAPEMDLLGWIGKPVVVLLNQLGPPRDAQFEDAERARWQRHLAGRAQVVTVLPLDAFARCWVQEITLLRIVEQALGGERRALMARLRAAWLAQRETTFETAMQSLAGNLARLAVASQQVPASQGFRERVRSFGAKLGLGGSVQDTGPVAQAQAALAERLGAELRANTLELIALHGLTGDAHGEILTRIATHYELRLRMDEGKAAMWGGMLTGAIAGLKADIVSGGLTLGGGLLAGGLIGALGAAGLARCVNLVRGTDRSWLAWNAEALDQMVEAALMRYLAVAHFGRGRGDWVEGEAPPHWAAHAHRALAPYRDALAVLWAERGVGDADPNAAERTAQALRPVIEQATRALLNGLYPGSLVSGTAAA